MNNLYIQELLGSFTLFFFILLSGKIYGYSILIIYLYVIQYFYKFDKNGFNPIIIILNYYKNKITLIEFIYLLIIELFAGVLAYFTAELFKQSNK